MEKLLKELMEEVRVGFKNVDSRFDGIDHRLDSMDARFDGIDHRLDSMDTRFDGIDHRLDSMDARFDGIDNRLDSMDTRLEKVEIGQNELRSEMHQGFADVQSTMKHNTTLLIENLTSIRKDFKNNDEDLGSDVNLLFKEVEGVKRRTFKLEQKIRK